MDEIIAGLNNLKNAIVTKGIADTKYIDLINSLIDRADKMRKAAMTVSAAEPLNVIPMEAEEIKRGTFSIQAENVTINIFDEEKESISPLGQ